MTDDELFVEIYSELKEGKRTEFGYLRTCGLLRQLFVDAHPFVFQIARKFNFKVTFNYSDYHDIATRVKKENSHHLMLTVSRMHPFKRTPLKQFLSNPALVLEGTVYTVKDIIQYGANIIGGVHKGMARNDKELLFAEHWKRPISINEIIKAIYQILQIVLYWLIGLRNLSQSEIEAEKNKPPTRIRLV